MKPPVPYRGNEPYIFISYSHKDFRKVWPVIERMQADGYRVWYDEGIDPGTEWDENIAAHVTGCEYFIAFISKNYIDSENCKDELKFSRDLGKKQLLIYLEEANLPEGMDMRFGRCQSLNKNGKGDFYQRLYDAEGISAFTNGEKIAVKKKKFSPLMLLPLVLLAAAGLVFMKPASQPETTAAENTTTATEDPFALRQESLLSKNDITLKTHDMYIDEEGNLILDVLAENKNDTNIDLFIDTTYINGMRCESEYDHTLLASAESHIFLKWRKEYLERDVADIIEKPEDVTKIQVKMTTKGFPDYQYFTYYPYGKENDDSNIFEPGENDFIIHDDENTRIVIANPHYNEENEWVIDIVSTNKSDRMTKIYTSFRDVNGYAYGPGTNEEMFPDSTVITNQVYSEWETTQKDKVYRANIHIAIQDIETYEMFEEKDVEVWFEEDTGITFEPRTLDSEDKIFIENEDIVVALIDTFEYNKANYAFRLYGYNKSDKELDVHFENYHKNGELVEEGFWSIMYLHPDTQSFNTQTINHANDVTSGNTDFDLVIEESTGGGDSVELYRKKIHLDFSW
ncbi:MAG: toll/interleukin-1 receptor domain-containing protein [Clostridia bacterium]|nr:toll/interleukin-1 receptor domain-containing protein [Clostridia bacterium]